MALLQPQRQKKTYQRGSVTCQKCATPIHVYRLKALAEEFSVNCPKCNYRGIYPKRAVTIQELVERRRKPRD
jgi:DNA-directed RNA polymerase subunit RPC12/RpoP